MNTLLPKSASTHGPREQQGFTLIELLVAMVIFAVLGTVAYQGLFQIQRVSDGVKLQSERLTRMQRTFYWLSDDVAQMIDRPVRSTLGSALPALEVSEAGEALLTFTRGGWTNPAADVLPPRSSLQRVAYVLEGDRLLRTYWYHLDQIDEQASRRRLLIDKVENFSMRFLQSSGEWHDSWPPASAEIEGAGMPSAIEFTLEFQGLGQVTRLFALPG